LTEMTLNIA